MRINKLSSTIGLSAVLLLGPLTAAHAQSPGIYLGASWVPIVLSKVISTKTTMC